VEAVKVSESAVGVADYYGKILAQVAAHTINEKDLQALTQYFSEKVERLVAEAKSMQDKFDSVVGRQGIVSNTLGILYRLCGCLIQSWSEVT